jgi:hypothetical protein
MAKLELTTKKMQIDKAQATIVGVIAASVFVTVFSLVSSRVLWTQRGYQARVIDQKTKAKVQLEKNVDSVKDLVASYQQFVESSSNMLGGNPAGTGDQDGDNARLVLDALPSKYDFPALTSSLEKILNDRHIEGTISGTDDEVAQSAAAESVSPQPVEIPFQISMQGSYASAQDLVSVFERSIRPFNIQKMTLSGGLSDMNMSLDVKTYFQPEKALSIKQEVVK